jgi:hypothetical protein
MASHRHGISHFVISSPLARWSGRLSVGPMPSRTVKYIPCTEAFATGRLIRVWRRVGALASGLGTIGARSGGNPAHGPAVFVDTRGSYVATEKQLVAPVHFQMVLGQRVGATSLSLRRPAAIRRSPRVARTTITAREGCPRGTRASSPRRALGGRARHRAVTVGATKAVKLHKVRRATMGPSVMNLSRPPSAEQQCQAF